MMNQNQQLRSKSGLTTASFVLGIVACSLNLLYITAPLGLIVGLTGLLLAGIAFMQKQKAVAGLVLGLYSLLIFAIYALTVMMPAAFDPNFDMPLFGFF